MGLWFHCFAVGKTFVVNVFPKISTKWIQLFILTASLQVATVAADQTAEELPGLFAQLLAENDTDTSASIEGQIWQHWLDAPDSNSASLLTQINGALRANRLEMALRLSNQLVDSSPDFSEAWNKRATVHYLMGNFPASVADIRETVQLEPRHFGAISGLGMIFLQENDLPAALQAFEQVLKISPSSINAKRSVESVRRKMEREI